MSIFEHLEAERGHRRRVDGFDSGARVTTMCEPTGAVTTPSLQPTEEWLLRGQIEVRFWCNRAQYAHARRDAERELAALLYADFLQHIARAQSAVSNGDREGAHAALDAMRSMILP